MTYHSTASDHPVMELPQRFRIRLGCRNLNKRIVGYFLYGGCVFGEQIKKELGYEAQRSAGKIKQISVLDTLA